MFAGRVLGQRSRLTHLNPRLWATAGNGSHHIRRFYHDFHLTLISRLGGFRKLGRGRADASDRLTAAAYRILREIHPCSVRAVCYQLFVQGFIANMGKNETNKVSRNLRDAREWDIIPWDWIIDETRTTHCVSSWENPEDYAEAVKASYRKDLWEMQPVHLEIWSEKSTIFGTIKPIIDAYQLPFRSFHGFASATAIHEAAATSQEIRKPFIVFYLGDWDPSGLHMSEADLPERIERYDGAIEVIRLALRPDDLEALPSFDLDSKKTDSRHSWFKKRSVPEHGSKCWEIDAMRPPILRDRVEEAILSMIDQEAWERGKVCEAAMLESLDAAITGWAK